jgi:hypothetical protein
MNIPIIKPLVTLEPPNPMRERRLQLIEQLAQAGPERFNLFSVISSVDNDYTDFDDEHSYGDLLGEMTASGKVRDPDFPDIIVESVTNGTCGRTACLGGHAQVVHYRQTKQWISFDDSIAVFELPRVTCESSVNEDHPHWKTFIHLLADRQFDEHYCEWLVSVMVVRDLIDDTSPRVEPDREDDWNDEDQLQNDGPF